MANNKIKKRIKQIQKRNSEWYNLRPILGHDGIFYLLLGGRETGKSYAVTSFFVTQYKTKQRPFYWLRLTEASQRKLLINNAEKLIDPDIRRRWNLDLETCGDSVYEVVERDDKGKIIEKRFVCRVLALSTFYNDKGSGLFDADFLKDPNMYYNICLDEMNRESNEKNGFDILYAFTNQLENLVRSTKKRVRVICIGNTLQEAGDILCGFNFIPESFGIFKLKKKRCVIHNIAPTDEYKKRRSGTIADILMPDASTFTNEVHTDTSLVKRGRLIKPQFIIKFTKDKSRWFTVWDSNTIAKYNGENCKDNIIPMRPYLDERFDVKQRDAIVALFDTRGYCFKNLITFKLFQKELTLLKPRK